MLDATSDHHRQVEFNSEKILASTFESGPIRPPSEGGSHSLLLRTTRNCPWNRCKFCYGIIYNRAIFERRSVDDIKKDIDSIKTISDEITSVSTQLGYKGKVTRDVGITMVNLAPRLNTSQNFLMVLNWLMFGGKTAFLQDANSLNMKTNSIVAVLNYLKKNCPTLDRITSYARSRTLDRKTFEELSEIRKAGLTRLHVGLETGDDELLKYMDKGVTSDQHVDACRKAKQAGFELSVYVMIDLGGRDMSDQHAANTARVLNEINPDFIRLRPFALGPDLPVFEDYEKGVFRLSSPHQRLEELKNIVSSLTITGRMCFDHFLNCWYTDSSRRTTLFKQDYEGYKFPEQKNLVLELIEKGLQSDESVHMHVQEIIGMKNL